MEHNSRGLLKSLPARIIRAGTSVVLKRGCTEIRFPDSHYADRLTHLLELTRHGSTEEQILDRVEEADREEARALLNLLRAQKIIVPISGRRDGPTRSESSLDIFYWQLEPQIGTVAARLESKRLVLLGANQLSHELSEALTRSGFQHVTTVGYPSRESTPTGDAVETESASSQKGLRLVPFESWIQSADWKEIDCLVATSDVGGRELLREWNELAVRHRCHFLSVVLQDMIGYVGPLVVPGESACYECLVARENSNLDHSEACRAVERTSNGGQPVVAFHPLMLSVLAAIAAFELVKFYGELIRFRNVGTLIEANLLAMRLTARKVLKIPRCVVCSSLLEQPSTSIRKPIPAHKDTRP